MHTAGVRANSSLAARQRIDGVDPVGLDLACGDT